MKDIIISGPLVPSTEDTPAIKGSRVKNISDIPGIEKPLVGNLFFVEETARWYIVKSLKEVQKGFTRKKVIESYEVFSSGSSSDEEIYVNVPYTRDQVNIPGKETRYAKVYLEKRSSELIQYLNIYGTTSGDHGNILVFQSGDITLALGTTEKDGNGESLLKGGITSLYGPGSIFLIKWWATDEGVYCHSETVADRAKEVLPSEINDLAFLYYGANDATLTWRAPAGSLAFDKVEEYDLRYATFPVDFRNGDGSWKTDEEIELLWSKMNRVYNTPIPSISGTKEFFGVKNLLADTYYCFAIRGKSSAYGAILSSLPSNLIEFRTASNTGTTEDNFVPEAINLTENNIYPKAESNASQPRGGAIDESGKVIREDDVNGIFLQKTEFSTYWGINPFSKSSTPFDYIIDLYDSYFMDSVFLATDQEVKFNVYILQELRSGMDWEKVLTEVTTSGYSGNQQWTKLSLGRRKCRFIRLAFECLDYFPSGGGVIRYLNADGGYETNTATGSKGFTTVSTASINATVPRIWELVAYGKPSDEERPSGIRQPLRRRTDKPTVDGFISANDQGYHQGRLSGLFANPHIRQYMSHANHTIIEVDGIKQPAKDEYNLKKYAAHWATPFFSEADIRSTLFALEKIGWVSNYSGLRDQMGLQTVTWRESLQRTYKKNGLKPFCTSTAPLPQTAIVYDDWQVNFIHHRYMDKYFTGDYNSMPYPVIGYQGWMDYFKETQDPLNYKMVAKLAYCLAKKYGRRTEDGSLNVNGYLWDGEDQTTGNDLLSGMEFFNEPDNTWTGFGGYMQPLEFAAVQSAIYDGHCGEIGAGASNWYGVKNADPDFLSIAPGFTSLYAGYLLQAYIWWFTHRVYENENKAIPLDILNTHIYFSNGGNQDLDTSLNNLMGCSVEYTLANKINPSLIFLPRMRDYYMPDKPIWVTEIGWGESGIFGYDDSSLKSQFQVRSLDAGRFDNDLRTTAPRFRGDIKGQYFVRAVISLMNLGYDMAHWFMTENNDNWFNTSKWGQGAGWEMFYWDKDENGNPVADADKITHNKRYIIPYGVGSFSGMGLFGIPIYNGGYPISRAFWFIKTFKERFTGYIFMGFKKPADVNDSRVVIACFKKKDNSGKGAYVVYYLNPNECSSDSGLLNRGRAAVQIALPKGVTQVTHVKTYVPQIPNPKAMDLGEHASYIDRKRSGLPSSRYERWNGTQWEVINPQYKDGDKLSRYSYTTRPADYPVNPRIGDEITILPTQQENPYFPIVGPVGAIQTNFTGKEELLTAQNYVEEGQVYSDLSLAWRQVDAVCDFVEHTEQGQRGSRGDERQITSTSGIMIVDVTEEPEYYFFEGIPVIDYEGMVEDVKAVALSPTSVKVWWNNTDARDSGYQVYVSQNSETGYSLYNNGQIFNAGTQNSAILENLKEDTQYFFKVVPRIGESVGTISSSYASACTLTPVTPPTGLYASRRSATSITLNFKWNGPADSFLYYRIYRASDSGAYALVGTVSSVGEAEAGGYYGQSYRDTGLSSEKNYSYKVRAYVSNGRSELSNQLDTSTVSAAESSPELQVASLHKLGYKVTLTFDLKLSDVLPGDAASLFSLTEAGDPRTITGISVIDNTLVLNVDSTQFSTFDKGKKIKVSYAGPKGAENVTDDGGNTLTIPVNVGGITSEHGVPLQDIEEAIVQNSYGNLDNIEHLFLVNIGYNPRTTPYWNHLVGDVKLKPSVNLVDYTFTRENGESYQSGISVTPVIEQAEYGSGKPDPYNWAPPEGQGMYTEFGTDASFTNTKEGQGTTLKVNGIGDSDEIPSEVVQSGWITDYSAGSDWPTKGRLKISGLDVNKKYTLRIASAKNAYGGDSTTTFFCTGITEQSEQLNPTGNTSRYVAFYDVVPSAEGVIFIDLLPKALRANPAQEGINFFILEEYGSGSDGTDPDVWIRDIEVTDIDGDPVTDGGSITSPALQFLLNLYGAASQYKIVEKIAGLTNEELFERVNWKEIPSSKKVLYDLSSPEIFGKLTILLKVRNQGGYESNTVAFRANYVDAYEEPQLLGVLINNGALDTTSLDVIINVSKTGKITQYCISENENFAGASWSQWTSGNIPYTFQSTGYGTKTIYVKLKGTDQQESEVLTGSLSSRIEYVESIEIQQEVVLSIPLSTLGVTSAQEVTVQIPKYKYNKQFAFSLEFDDMQASWFNNIVEYVEGRPSSLLAPFHPGYNDGTGGTAVSSPLRAESIRCHTDGCGNDVPFRIGCAVNPYSSYGDGFFVSDNAEGNAGSSNMWKTEIARALDFDHGITNHGDQSEADTQAGALEVLTKVREYIKQITGTGEFFTGRSMWYMTRPSNKEHFYEAMTQIREMYVAQANGYENSTYDGDYFVTKDGEAIDISNCTPQQLYQSKRGRAFLSTYNTAPARFGVVERASANGTWTELFGHTGDVDIHGLKTLIDSIYAVYGKGGNDSIWFGSVNEIFTYILMRAASTVTKTVEGENLVIRVNTCLWRNMWNKEFSLLIKRVDESSIPGNTVNDNPKIYGLSSGIQPDGSLLVNVNYNPEVDQLAYKYLTIFQQYPSEKTLSFVNYFMNRMKQGEIRSAIQAQVDQLNAPFSLQAITLAGGATETGKGVVSVKFSYSGFIVPKYYRISEDPDFTGLEWQEYPGSEVSFTLSPGYGFKKIYAQMKLDDSSQGSASVNASITYLQQAIKAIIAVGWDTYGTYKEGFFAEYGIQAIKLTISAKEIKNTAGDAFGTILSVNNPIDYGSYYGGQVPGSEITDKLNYPDTVFTRNSVCRKNPAPASFTASTAGLVKITVPPGIYTVRVFGNQLSARTETSTGQDRYGVSTDGSSFSSRSYPNGTVWGSNFKTQLLWTGMDASNGEIYVGWYNSQTDKSVPLNTIELEKTA